MEAYTAFAQVYDLFMDNVPYGEWCDYLISLLREYGIADGLVLDLGCGTGEATRRLSEGGYDMIGVDISCEMLQIAKRKAPDILFLQQDLREFELYGTVRAAVSICDSMNYLLEYEELVQVLGLVNNYLDPGGIFIFDFNTLYLYREIIGNQTIAENRDEGSFIWENDFDEEKGINEYGLTFFVREEDGLYRKYTETHYQRSYPLPLICQAVQRAGMELIAVYDAFTKNPPREDSARLCVVAREKGKLYDE